MNGCSQSAYSPKRLVNYSPGTSRGKSLKQRFSPSLILKRSNNAPFINACQCCVTFGAQQTHPTLADTFTRFNTRYLSTDSPQLLHITGFSEMKKPRSPPYTASHTIQSRKRRKVTFVDGQVALDTLHACLLAGNDNNFSRKRRQTAAAKYYKSFNIVRPRKAVSFLIALRL